ncbi:TetR/AcrR family transcriptional regulator [Microbacterium sp. GXF7504]
MTTTTPTRPRRDAVANRAALLTAARRVVAQDPAASMDAIARAAGLSRRAVYGHFADRDALLSELIRTGADRFNAIAAQLDDTDAPTALARLAVRLWREAAQVRFAASLALDETHLAETAAALRPLRERVLAIVRAGQDAGSIRTDLEAPLLARLIEEAARTAVVRLDVPSTAVPTVAVKAVLGIAGLSWRESLAVLTANPDLEQETD